MRHNYLLDTNICIALLKNDKRVIEQVISVGQKHCFVSEITVAELFYGAAKSGKESHFDDVQKIVQIFGVIPIYPSLRVYGEIKAQLEQKGQRIDEFDLLIGASALKNKMTIVTANIKHLGRIPNIEMQNWMEE